MMIQIKVGIFVYKECDLLILQQAFDIPGCKGCVADDKYMNLFK